MAEAAAWLEDLDLEVSSRQAFGAAYQRPAKQAELTELVMGGALRLPPHPDWTGDLTDWRADPFGDRNWQFQHHTLRWLNALRWSALDGDSAARDEWRRIVASWSATNLPPAKHPGQFAWKDMADGNRAIELSLGAPLLRPEDDWYIGLMRAHIDWLIDEQNIASKNHALHQHSGLLVAAATLRDEEALETAHRRMVDQFESTFDAQGANDEGAIGYHANNLQWWGQAWARVDAEGRKIPEFVADRLTLGREAMAQMTLPNGQLPQIGDTKRVRANRTLGPQVEFIVSKGKRGTAPQETAIAYERGYVISRSGWGETLPLADESHMLLRFGADLRAHSHQDRGSVHLYSLGRPWLTDSGFHSYQNGDPTREHFLSRAAHNIAYIPDLRHDDRAIVELERFEVDVDFHDAVVVDRGYDGLELRRRVLYLTGPDCWVIWDESSRPETIIQNWHVDIGVDVSASPTGDGFTLQADDRAMTMAWLGEPTRLARHPAQEGDLRGWISTRWKTLEPGTLVTAESHEGPPRSVLVVAPTRESSLEIVRSSITPEGILDGVVARGAQRWDLTVADGTVRVRDHARNPERTQRHQSR